MTYGYDLILTIDKRNAEFFISSLAIGVLYGHKSGAIPLEECIWMIGNQCFWNCYTGAHIISDELLIAIITFDEMNAYKSVEGDEMYEKMTEELRHTLIKCQKQSLKTATDFRIENSLSTEDISIKDYFGKNKIAEPNLNIKTSKINSELYISSFVIGISEGMKSGYIPFEVGSSSIGQSVFWGSLVGIMFDELLLIAMQNFEKHEAKNYSKQEELELIDEIFKVALVTQKETLVVPENPINYCAPDLCIYSYLQK